MVRFLPSLMIALAMCATTSASLHKFVPGTVPPGENPLLLLDSGNFELSDSPINSIQYPALQSFGVRVFGSDGAVDFDLLRASTTNGHVNFIFDTQNTNNGLLFLQFDVPSISPGDPIPPAFDDADGVINWNTPMLQAPSQNTGLAGSMVDASVAVPEPSAVAFGGVAIGLVGACRLLRRRFHKV